MLHKQSKQLIYSSPLRPTVAPLSRSRRLLFVLLIALLAGVVGLLLIFVPNPSAATYRFTDTAQPRALAKLDKTPVDVSPKDNGFAGSLADKTTVEYTRRTSNQPFMTVSHGKNKLQLGMLNARSIDGETDANVVTYNGILPDTNLIYTHFKDYVKEDIVAGNKESAESVGFFIPKKDGVSLRRDKARGIIASHDGIDLFYFHPPVAKDKNGKVIAYEYVLNERNDSYHLYLMPSDNSQLDNIAYPLTIDPTVSWTFESQAPYYLSDPAKIEVAGGVLRLVSTGGNYPIDNPFAVTNTPVPYSALSGFIETLGSNNQGAVRYQLSRTGNAWYYWNGSTWATASNTDYNQANTAATVNAQISAFASQFGSGSVYVKAFLHANNATTPTELQSFTVTYTLPTGPSVSDVSPNSGSYLGGTSVTVTGSNFSNTWLYRKKLTIDEAKIPGTQTLQDYPLLVNRVDPELRSTANGGHVGKANGGDIRFRLPNGTKLDHEIEKYDPLTGELVAWVRIPYLSATSNTDLWLDYGNAAAGNQWNPTAVWNSNYKAVYHLSDASPNDAFATLDTSKWYVFGDTVLNAGRVQSSISSTAAWSSAGINSASQQPITFGGDFDFQIDFDTSAWTNAIPTDGHEVNLQLASADGSAVNYYYVTYQKYPNGTKSFLTWQDETAQGWGAASTTVTSSKLRMVRSGSTLTAYGWNGTAWVTVGSYSSAKTSRRMSATFYTSNRTSGTGVQNVFFDNFTVNAGAPIKDSTSNGNTAYNVSTTATPTTGKIGTGYNFTGATTSYIQIPNSSTLENLQESTYSLQGWINPPSIPGASPDNTYALITKAGYHDGLRYNIDTSLTQDIWLAGSTPINGAATSATGYAINNYHMAVGTMDKAAGQGKIYVDGNASSSTFTANAAMYEHGQTPWRIGVADPASTGYRWLAKGVIDEVRLTSAKLSPDWATTEYNNQNSPGTFYATSPETSGVGVRFGGTDSPAVQIVNNTTLTATTPTHAAGTFDVDVIGADGQSVTLPGSFTFTTPNAAPSISDVSPNFGSTNGGTDVTVTGNNFMASNKGGETSWASAGTLPAISSTSALAVVGSNVYLFGGYEAAASDRIMQASVSDPTAWTDTGKKLPGALAHSTHAVVGGYIYLFGGFNAAGANTDVIYRAPVSDPTTWTDTGKKLPVAIRQAQAVVVGDTIYMYGGNTTSAYVNTIYKAPVSDPTSWSLVSGKTLPGPLGYSASATIGNYIYLFGGSTASGVFTNVIYRAPVSDPTTWTDTGKKLPVALYYAKQSIAVIGDYVYIFGGGLTGGGFSNAIYKAPISDPTSWTTSGSTLPAAVSQGSVAVLGNYVYYFGAWNSASQNFIYRAPVTQNRPNNYSPSWKTDWPTVQSDLSTVTIGGQPLTNIQYVDANTITGTTAAGAAGLTDVFMRNPDGQSATLSAAYEYRAPPAIDAATPSSSAITGGETITLTGTNFRGGMAVTFDGVPGSSVQVVNASTLTVNAPAHPLGSVKIVASNEYGTSAAYSPFTYHNVPAAITGVTPSSGPSSGGTNITITGTGFAPKNSGGATGWANVGGKTIPAPVSQYNSAVIGGYVYIFGGYNQTSATWVNTIYRAPVSDPTSWTNTGKTLPGTSGGTGASLVIVGDYIYILDGNQVANGAQIYRAPISDPTTWTNTGKTIPVLGIPNQVTVIGSKIYIFGGWTTGSTYVGTILSANVSDPTTWTNTGKSLPGGTYLSQFFKTATDMYIIGGTNGAVLNTIWKASISDPTTWTNTGKTFPVTIGYGAQAIIGDYAYIFGGVPAGAYSNKIYRAALSDLTTWTDTGSVMPATWGLGNASVIGDYVYVFGGYNGSARTNIIHRAPVSHFRQNLYNIPWHTDWATTAIDQTGVMVGGVAATNVQVVNSTTVTATTPANAQGAKDVAVISDDGTPGTLTNGFTYYNAPTLTAVTPNTTTIAGGDTLTVTGNDFRDGATITLNGVPATATFIDSHTLTFVVPPLSAGIVDLTVTNPDGQSATLAGAVTVIATIDRVSFATAPATMRPGGIAKVVVQTQDYMGRGLPVDVDTTIDLAALSGSDPSATGSFSLSKSAWEPISQVTIPGGQTSAELYYKETAAGTYTLKANETPSSNWTDASKTVVVSADAPHTWPFDEPTEYTYDNTKITIAGGMAQLKDNANFQRGSGSDGAVTVSGTKNINTDILASGRTCADGANFSVTALTSTTATLAASAAACLQIGDEILLINQQGTSTATANAGNYEFLRVASVSGTAITFSAAKQKYYGNAAGSDAGLGTTTTTQRVMLQRVPNYTTINVPSGTTLTANAWDGTKGGIVAFRAYATAAIDGTVTMAGKGFRGGNGNTVPGESQFGPGAYSGESYGGTSAQTRNRSSANFSGGGNGQSSTTWAVNQNGGAGAGGGYGVAGANGTNSTSGHTGGGGGSAAGNSIMDTLFLGSGGGGGGQAVWGAGGNGSAGGGSIFMSAATVQVNGTVTASGNAGLAGNTNSSHEGGGGGGGAGGAVLIMAQAANIGTTKVTSAGGAGGVMSYGGGDGGAGGAGRVSVQTVQIVNGTSNPAFVQKGYATDNPVITPNPESSIAYTTLTSFTEGRGSSPYQGSVRYQLSPDKGTNWYWYNGSAWVQATGSIYAQTSSAATINSNIASFDDQVGEGDLLIRAYLHADTAGNPVELDGVSVGYDQTPQNPASLTGISPASGPVDGGNTATLTGTGFMSEYQRAATVTNSGAARTNSTEIIKIDTAGLIAAGKMRSDCRDLRVLDNDKVTLLTFAVVSGCNSANTSVAIRFSNLPSGATTIYLDYGNTRKAAAGNMWSTFPVLSSSDLATWLRADDGATSADGTAVGTWVDQSSKGYNFGQATTGKRPIFKTNILNGKPVLRFDGSDDQIDYQGPTLMTNNFTTFTVARPTTTHEVEGESTSSSTGTSGQRYMWGVPQFLNGASGAGASVGTNGVSVYEHAESYMPPLAVYGGSVSGFTSVGIQYTNRQPSIYTNGQLRRTGQVSPKNPVNWSGNLGCGSYGCWSGDVAEYLAFNSSLSNADRQEAETYLNAKYNLYDSSLPVSLDTEQNLLTVDFGTERGTVTATTATTAQVTVPHGVQLGKVDIKLTSVDTSTATLPQAYRYYASRYAVVSAPDSLKELEPGTVTIAAQDMQGNSYIMDQDTALGLSSTATTGFFARDLDENIQTRWDYNSVVFPTGATVATFHYRDNAKGDPTVTVAPPADETTVPAIWQPHITSRYRLLVTGVSDPVKSGIPSSITIQAVDYTGEPLNDYKGSVHFTSTDGAAFLPEDSEITEDMLGGKTFVNGITMVTEGDWCVTVTDVNDPDITGEQCGISVGSPNEGTIAKLAFITAPQNFAATSQSGVITVQSQDSTGAPIPVAQNTTLYIYSDSATGQLSLDGSTNWSASPLAVTLRAGTTATSFFYKDTTLGAHKLTVREDEGTGADFGWINAQQTIGVGVGNAYQVKITAPQGPFTAGQISPAFRVTLQDELGNEVPVFSPQRIWITGSGGTDELSPDTDFAAHAVTRLPLTVQPGDTGADFYYRDTFAGNRTVTASDSDPPNGDTGLLDDQVPVTVGGGAPTQIAFASAPFELVAGVASNTVSVELRDSLGNKTLAQEDTRVYLYADYPGAEFRNVADSAAIASVVIPNGQSTASFKLKQKTFRATQTIVASDGSGAPDGDAGLADASQTEVITAGTPTKLAITTPAPATSPVGTVMGPVNAELQNQYGVTIPATSDTGLILRSTSTGGSFALDPAGPWSSTLSPPLATGSSNLTFYYKDTRAGTATVTVADEASGGDTGLTNATQNMTFTAGGAARVSITSSPQSLQAGQPSAAMTVRLEDQYGNPVNASSNLSVVISTNTTYGRFDSASGGSYSNDTIARTINSGQSSTTFYYKDYAAGTPVLTASATGLASGTQTETITWGGVTRIDITGPGSITAGQASGPFTIYPYNAYNVIVPTVGPTTVNLSTNNGSGRFDTSAGGSFSGSVTSAIIPAGSFSGTFYYRATQAGSHTITGVSGSMNDTLAVNVGATTADHLRITSAPQTLQLGQVSSAITIRAEDIFGNQTNVDTLTNLSLSTSSATGQFRDASSGGTAITTAAIAANNSSTYVYYVDYEVGTPALTVNSSFGPLTQTETIVTGAPAHLYFWADSTSLTAGTPKLTYVFTANNYGTIIPATGDTTVTLSTNNPSTGRFDTNIAGGFDSNNITVTIPDGSTNTSFYYRDTATGGIRITGQHTGYSNATYDFNINPAAPYRISFANSVRTTTAGNVSDYYTMTLYDAYGNVTTAGSSVSVTVTDTEPTAQLSANGSGGWSTGSMVRTIPAGQTSASFYYKDTVAGGKTISASATGLVGASQNTSVGAASFHHFGFTTSPQTIVVQNPSGPITVSGYDIYGNQRTMPNATLNLTTGSPQGSFSLSNTTWSNVSSLGIVNGTYTSTFYYKDARLANTVITATPTASFSAITQPVTITAGNVSGVRFTSNQQTVVTSTPSKVIDVRLTDDNGYPAGASGETTVTVTSDSGTGEFSVNGTDGWSASNTLTYQPGETLKQLYFRDSTEGTVTMNASADGLTSGSQPITVIPGVVAQVSVVADSTASAGAPLPITIETLTADGLGAAVAGNTIIQLSASNGGQFSLSDTNWQPVTSITIPAGQYQRALFYRNTTSGPDTITAMGPAANDWTDGTASISVGAGAYVKLAFLTLPQSVNAGAPSGQIVVQARDQYGNATLPADDQTLYMYGPAEGQFATDSAGPWDATSVVMPAGTGTAIFYYNDAVPGSKTLRVSDKTPLDNPDQDIVNAVGQIAVASLPPTQLRFITPERTAIAGERSEAVTIEAAQANGDRAIVGTPLTIRLSTDGLDGAFYANSTGGSPITQVTLPVGGSQATVYYRSEKAGTHKLTAASTGLMSSNQNINVVAAAANKLVFITPAQNKAADEESDQITLQFQDAFNNPATNDQDTTVALTSSSVTGQFSLEPGTDWSAISGITVPANTSDTTFYYRDITSGTHTLTGTSDGIAKAEQTFTVAAGTAVGLRFATPVQSLVAGQASEVVTVVLSDEFGNAVSTTSNLTVHLGSTSGQASFSATQDFAATRQDVLIPAGASAASFYFKDRTTGTPTITAADLPLPDNNPDNGLVNASQQAVITAGAPDHLAWIAPATGIAGQPVHLEVELQNTYGVPVSPAGNTKIYLNSVSGSGVFSTNSDMSSPTNEVNLTAGSTRVDVYYRDTAAGVVDLTARDTQSADGGDVGIRDATYQLSMLPESAARLRIISSAQNLEAGEPSSMITVQIQDIFGNAVIATTGTDLYIGSSSAGGAFAADASFSPTITTARVVAGSSNASFFYRDDQTGTPVITVSDNALPESPDLGLANATQNINISAGSITKLGWASVPATLEAGEASAAVRVQAQNRFGVATPVTVDTVVYLEHTASSSSFSTTPGGPWTTTRVTIPAGQKEFTVYYRNQSAASDTLTASDTDPSSPDSGWTNGTATINVTAGAPVALAFSTPERSIIARHTSPAYVVEARNRFGVATPVTSDTSIYLRSTVPSPSAEFAASANGSWGINYVTIPAGQSSAVFYYHDLVIGTPTLTASDNLPVTPDTGLLNATQSATITKQVIDHFLVTNISTPQVQGTSTSVVVVAQDSDNYIIDDYAGTITFSSSDPDAVLPEPYTFDASEEGDESIHTFTNGVAFLHEGIKSVTVTDQNGITGSQSEILVGANTAGPITGLKFTGVSPPLVTNADTAAGPITVQAVDTNGQASNAPEGGYKVRLTSNSAGGQYALNPAGPWSDSLVATIPAHLSSVNVYYRDSQIGSHTLTATDWQGGSDDPGISNAALNVQVRALQIDVETKLEVNNNSHYYAPSNILYAKNSNGQYYARSDFVTTVKDKTTGLSRSANLTYTWRSPEGAVLATQTATNTSSYTYHLEPIDGIVASEGDYTLEILASDPVSGVTGRKIVPVHLSGWVVKLDYDPDNKALGQPLPYTIRTYYNGVLQDPVNMLSVNFRDDNGEDVPGDQYSQTLGEFTRNGVGSYSSTMPTTGLKASEQDFGNAYYLYARIFDSATEQNYAEDNHYDIFFQNNPAVAPKNFQIEKIQTSTPPAEESYDLKFKWDSSLGATKYVIYRTQNKFAGLFSDPCSIDQVKFGHRFGDPGATTPFCETAGQHVVGSDDATQWVEMATVNAPGTSATIPWAQLQADLPGSTYFYLVRAENASGQMGYSTMTVSAKKHFVTNAAPQSSINWISLPYNATIFTNAAGSGKLLKASDVVKEIEGSMNGSAGNDRNKKISRVALWDSSNQTSQSFLTYSTPLHRWTGTDFTINPGDGIYLQPTQAAGFDWTVVGNDVVNSLTLQSNTPPQTNLNWVSIPYSGKYEKASDVIKDFEGALNGASGNERNRYISRIARWDNNSQASVEFMTYSAPLHRWIGNDFVVNPGDGVYVQLSGGQLPFQWVPPLIINPYN